MNDPSHPLQNVFKMLPSTQIYYLPLCKTNRFKNSFIPAAIGFLSYKECVCLLLMEAIVFVVFWGACHCSIWCTTGCETNCPSEIIQSTKIKNHFWFHKEPLSPMFFKKTSLSYLFRIWRTFFCHNEALVKQKEVLRMLKVLYGTI